MKTKYLLFFICVLIISACKKTEKNNTPASGDTYLNTTSGSTWNYHETNSSGPSPINSDYTLTSTSRDSSISGRSYHIFTNTAAGNQYFNISGNDYYQFDSLPAQLGASVFERLYLKDNAAAGINWNQTLNVTISGIPFPIPVTITNTITEKGISRMVNGTNYSDVIHVSTSISSSLIPSASLVTSIDSYYAKKYGLIENTSLIQLNYLGLILNVNTETKLLSANLK